MLSKILLYTIRGKNFWQIFFFFNSNSVNSLIYICLSDLKDQTLLILAIKTRMDHNRQKILLACGAHKLWWQLACSNFRPNQAIRPLLLSNPDSCEIISKSDLQFLRRFLKNFFMSVGCKKPPFTREMFIDGSKFCKQFLKRVTQGTFPVKLFQNLTCNSENKIF